ncbi:hypothetical protein BJ742DRAFT_380664 [Cladochytrium replicatum]|nr:hypothetical protein BJ742DRAFT_380664 [Cladochytrium replicatum]
MVRPHSLTVHRLARHALNSKKVAWGPPRPKELRESPNAANLIPTFLHGKGITFADRVSKDYGNRTKRAFFPNVLYHHLYSRVLDISVCCRVSAAMLREVDQRGGIDEYLLTVSDEKIGDDEIAVMLREKVRKAYHERKDEIKRDEEVLLGRMYGPDFIK